jgi:hypothetical protein
LRSISLMEDQSGQDQSRGAVEQERRIRVGGGGARGPVSFEEIRTGFSVRLKRKGVGV